MRVLVVGGGGREHALIWGISRSPDCEALFCAPGNAGTALLLRERGLGDNLFVAAEDIEGVIGAAREQAIDFVVVGPEAPLAAGMVDALAGAGFLAFGPRQAAAEIESSKWFAKEIMREAGVRHAAGASFRDPGAAHAFIDGTFPKSGPPPVIKADGLAAGKGVIVPGSMAAAHAAVDELLGGRFGAASATVVVEERLSGLEASAIALVDGETVLPLPLSCDYKRALDGDAGLNTGGMGVYSPPGFMDPDAWSGLVESVHRPVARAMQAAGRPYQGVLYGGLMVPIGESGQGGEAAVIEFNCRFGDPEVQVLLPQLRSDLLELLVACAEGRLETVTAAWSGEAAVGVVLASGGYPGAYETGKLIRGLDTVDDDVLVFHAGTALDGEGNVVTSGGRVLIVVGWGPDLATARERAYANASRIKFEGRHYRTDIAARELS